MRCYSRLVSSSKRLPSKTTLKHRHIDTHKHTSTHTSPSINLPEGPATADHAKGPSINLPEGRATADDAKARSGDVFNLVTPKERVVFDATFPEVLRPVARRKIELDRVFVVTLALVIKL